MQGAAVSRTLESLPGLAGVLPLRTGGAYATDSLSLAMALMAGPSTAGEWAAVVGMPDFGLEAAAAYGLDLDRTVVVPRPGEHWLSVTAGLLDVAGVVLVRPYAAVTEHQAERLRARLRQKDAALVCLGAWPRADATLRVDPLDLGRAGSGPRAPGRPAGRGGGPHRRLAAHGVAVAARAGASDRAWSSRPMSSGVSRSRRRNRAPRTGGAMSGTTLFRSAKSDDVLGSERDARANRPTKVMVVWCPDWPVVAAAAALGVDPQQPLAVVEHGEISPARRPPGSRGYAGGCGVGTRRPAARS